MFLQKGLWNISLCIYMYCSCMSCRDNKISVNGGRETFYCITEFTTDHTLKQWSQTQFLEGHSSAEFSSNQLQITPAWKFLLILKTLISWKMCVWLELELNCAELWPSRNWVWDQYFKETVPPPPPPKKILTSCTDPHVVPNLYKLSSSVEHKRRYFENASVFLSMVTNIFQNISFYVQQKKKSYRFGMTLGWINDKLNLSLRI